MKAVSHKGRRRVGILLSGSGAFDGSDAHEAVLGMLAIQESGHELVCLAMDARQLHVVDHMTAMEDESAPERAIMVEAARLVRGRLYSLEEISPNILDGLVIPGGQGAVKNLMNAFEGPSGHDAAPAVRTFLEQLHQGGRPIGAISLAEFLLTAVFGPWPHGKGCLDLKAEEVLSRPAERLYLTPGMTVAAKLPELLGGIRNLLSAMFEH